MTTRVAAVGAATVFECAVGGGAMVAPPHSPGGTREIGPGDAKFLSVAIPGGFGPDYFTEIRDVLRRHGLIPA